MADLYAAYMSSVCNNRVTIQEDLDKIGSDRFDYKVKPGDVLEFLPYEDTPLKKLFPPGIPGYDIYAAVYKNNEHTWILLRRCCINRNGENIVLYDLADKFHYPGHTGELLMFLCDLSCPVTVTKDGITW